MLLSSRWRPGTKGEDDAAGLAAAAGFVGAPVALEGSLDNLKHFLGKEPGRPDFVRPTDRRRAEKYLRDMPPLPDASQTQKNAPEWAVQYTHAVNYLFDRLQGDVYAIAGLPAELVPAHVSCSGTPSGWQMAEQAVKRFSELWIPPGSTVAHYSVNRREIRQWLLKSRRFRKRMQAVDEAWMSLTAGLYNLLMDEQWQMAVSLQPELEEKLDELIIAVIAADFYRRGRDMMILVQEPRSDTVFSGAASPDAGILWMPEFSYYKNIPELTGFTADTSPTIFLSRVSIGYTFRDTITQTWLNRRKNWLADYFVSFFSSLVKEDFSPSSPADRRMADWREVLLKARAVHGINCKIAATHPFGSRRVYGVRELAFTRVNLVTNY